MIKIMAWDKQGQREAEPVDEPGLRDRLVQPKAGVVWVDMDGPDTAEARHWLTNVFQLHPLTVENCIDVNELPKVDEFAPEPNDKHEPYLHLVIHGMDSLALSSHVATTEADLLLSSNYLVTFHEKPMRSIGQMRDRLERGATPPIHAADRLALLLINGVATDFAPALDGIDAEIERIEQRVVTSPDPSMLDEIRMLNRRVTQLQRIIRPQSEVVQCLARGEFNLIRRHLLPYFRDAAHVYTRLESQARASKDALGAIQQTCLGLAANQTSQVMKILTLITLLTMPALLVSTWYGMNFKNMPELENPRAYALSAVVTALMTLLLYLWFKRKKWF